MTLAEKMLERAAALVGGDRARDYGDKLLNHERIAGLWEFWFQQTGRAVNVEAYDVAMCMILLKIARLMNSPGHTDTHIDIAGYASILDEIAVRQNGDNDNRGMGCE